MEQNCEEPAICPIGAVPIYILAKKGSTHLKTVDVAPAAECAVSNLIEKGLSATLVDSEWTSIVSTGTKRATVLQYTGNTDSAPLGEIAVKEILANFGKFSHNLHNDLTPIIVYRSSENPGSALRIEKNNHLNNNNNVTKNKSRRSKIRSNNFDPYCGSILHPSGISCDVQIQNSVASNDVTVDVKTSPAIETLPIRAETLNLNSIKVEQLNLKNLGFKSRGASFAVRNLLKIARKFCGGYKMQTNRIVTLENELSKLQNELKKR